MNWNQSISSLGTGHTDTTERGAIRLKGFCPSRKAEHEKTAKAILSELGFS